MSPLYSNDPKGLWKEIHNIAGSAKHINNIHPNLYSNEFNTFFCECEYKDIRNI